MPRPIVVPTRHMDYKRFEGASDADCAVGPVGTGLGAQCAFPFQVCDVVPDDNGTPA